MTNRDHRVDLAGHPVAPGESRGAVAVGRSPRSPQVRRRLRREVHSHPVVRVLRGGTVESQFLAFEPGFRGGVRVAIADALGSTRPALVLGAGPGGGPRVKVMRADQEVVVPDYFAFEGTLRSGVFVA